MEKKPKLNKGIIVVSLIILSIAMTGVLTRLSQKTVTSIRDYQPALFIIFIIGTFLVCLLISYLIIKIIKFTIVFLSSYSTLDLLIGGFGAIFALIIALLLGISIQQIPKVGVYVNLIVSIVFAYIGIYLSTKRREEIMNLFTRKKSIVGSVSKYIDSSVLVDGRILDIARTGFLEGEFYVPDFVISELQLISDSSDDMKRTKGRRGLDVIKELQNEKKIILKIFNSEKVDFGEINDVDNKLVKTATLNKGEIITTDYNLNKVCVVQGIKVLNINDLANSIKSILVPGEKIEINILKKGKEEGQGVAYFDDGTMIIIEDGGPNVGEKIFVTVTNIMQTSAGRLVFARVKVNE